MNMYVHGNIDAFLYRTELHEELKWDNTPRLTYIFYS